MWPFARPDRHVLILCTANICRSPVAAALLRQHLKALGAGRRVGVESAGVEVAAPGAPADPRMVALARDRGVKLRAHRAQALSEALLAATDLVLVMEPSHLHALAADFPRWQGPAALLDPSDAGISDPYFGSRADVREAFEQIDAACAAQARRLAAA